MSIFDECSVWDRGSTHRTVQTIMPSDLRSHSGFFELETASPKDSFLSSYRHAPVADFCSFRRLNLPSGEVER